MFEQRNYKLIGYSIYNGKTVSEKEMLATYYGMICVIRTLNAKANMTKVRYTFEEVG